jgi:hypothetical protein
MDDTVAFEAMLEEAVAARAAAVVETAASNGPCKPATGELVA